MWNCIVEPENYPVSPTPYNVKRPSGESRRKVNGSHSRRCGLSELRPLPANLGGAVSVTLLRHVSDVTWGNKARERKGEEGATLLPLSTCAAREMAS